MFMFLPNQFGGATASVAPCSTTCTLNILFCHSCAPAVPSNAPQNIRSSLLTATSAEILWDPPPPDHQNGVIQSYIFRVTEVDTGRIIAEHYAENASITLQELQPLYTYQFVVAASTVAGLGPFSSQYSLQVPESG